MTATLAQAHMPPPRRQDRRKQRGQADRQTTAASSDQFVERSDPNFVHSDSTTRRCVTRPTRSNGDTANVVIAKL
jgi:hypothetical protein